MGNTEINSLFEIAINLENKGLYAQADKARNIMVRLSQGGMYFVQPPIKKTNTQNEQPVVINDIIEDILFQAGALTTILGAFRILNFIPFLKKNLPFISQGYALQDGLSQLIQINNLAQKFDWKKFVSGEDTTGAEIADKIIAGLEDFCLLFSHINPAFSAWAWIFGGIRSTINVKNAQNLGYWAGGMPGGIEQMSAIQSFNLNDVTSDPYIQQIISSILKELGIGPESGRKAIENSSKIPQRIGGLDFFIPYIKKFDTKRNFTDWLSSNASVKNMELKSALLKLIPYIKGLQQAQKLMQPKGK